MLKKYIITELADVIAFVADYQDLIRVCVLHALAAVCLNVSGLSYMHSSKYSEEEMGGQTWIPKDDH